MRIKLFGPLAVENDAGPVDLGPPKQRMVLAVLLLRANEVVSTDRIIDRVWGDAPPRTAAHSVQIYVSELRKILDGVAVIETRAPGYVVRVPTGGIDINRYESLVTAGVAHIGGGEEDEGLLALKEAQDLWSGPPLQEFQFDDFAGERVRRLREARADSLEALAGVHLERGDLGDARELCRQLIADDPFRETPRRLMMLSLYRAGRQADALREYGSFQRLLADELGIEASRQLQDLEERILLQDPSLSGSSAPPTEERNPYRGLRAFSEEDSDVFFGREDLIEEVLGRLTSGSPMVSLVGPSGSGKSSVLNAGVIPQLRATGHNVVSMQPGARPLWELSGSLEKAGFGSRAQLFRSLEHDVNALATVVDRQLVVVVDQLEELFTLAETEATDSFAGLLSNALREERCPLSVVTALRADYFDRPLSMATLATHFASATLSVAPMSARGLERAIVEPARRVGGSVDRDLLVQLITEMRDQPGALPLLQYTLFELFQRAGSHLTLDEYTDLGGLSGALTTAADETFQGLDLREADLAEQLFVRLVKKGRRTNTSSPVPIKEVMELGDHLDLQRVLEAFGERRLLTFNRDVSGRGVVEMAHEYLIAEWPQLGVWLSRHTEDMDRLAMLGPAVEEWESNERSEDFLFRGQRLQQMVDWRDATRLRLTSAESAFIECSIELRDRPPPPPDVVVWFDRRGDGSFGDLVGAGIDAAVEELGVAILEHVGHISQMDAIEVALERGTRLVVVGSLEAGNPLVADLVERHPEVLFVLLGAAPVHERLESLANVRRLTAANEEMGFVAGAAAALASDKGKVGFIGGLSSPMILHFQGGFEHGVSMVDPGCVVEQVYLTDWASFMTDMSGFNSVAMCEAAAAFLYQLGVDVIFHASGGSGWGLFRWAARKLKEDDERIWTIGVDVDQANQLEIVRDEWGLDPADFEAMKEVMLTSVVWRLDDAIRHTIGEFFRTGSVDDSRATISNDRVGFVPSGRLDEVTGGGLVELMERVRNDEIEVSQTPVAPARLLFDALGV